MKLTTFFAGLVSGTLLVVLVLLAPKAFSATHQMAAVVSSLTAGSSDSSASIACARAAVESRESAILQANDYFERATNNAYSTRTLALSNAYSQSTWSDVQSATKSAFNDFNDSMKAAGTDLAKENFAAASAYDSAITACQKLYPSMPHQQTIRVGNATPSTKGAATAKP